LDLVKGSFGSKRHFEADRLIVNRFLGHPDVKKALRANIDSNWQFDGKNVQVITAVTKNIKAAIEQYKNSRSSKDLLFSLLGLLHTEERDRLVRATARLFGLKSRMGLTRHSKRVAAKQV
jgi:hypothetical protein